MINIYIYMPNPTKCCCSEKLTESIQILNIVYKSDETCDQSVFDPGETLEEKKLIIRIRSDLKLCRGTKLKLKLFAIKDDDYVRTKIDPIKTRKTLCKTTKKVKFILESESIPLPHNVTYLPTIVENCPPILETGTALEYYFVLKITCGKCNSRRGFPLVARYIGADCKADIKCEMLTFTDTPDEDHPIKILCGGCGNSQITYTNLPHCVTHAQAPRPIEFYYVNE
jgi:hypothetical protein